MMPDCIASTVFLPITLRGRATSILRSCAPLHAERLDGDLDAGRDDTADVLPARGHRVERRRRTEVDDDRGPPYSSTAATALMMRSAPTSLGLSVRIGTPVFTPGSTRTAGTSP